MTAVYDKNGLNFMYPENWKLTDNDELPIQVSVETPSGGIWSVNVFEANVSSDSLLDEAIDGLQESYEDVEISEANTEIAGFPAPGIDAYFYCLDFMVIAKVRVIELEQRKLVLHYQAESRDFDSQQDVFQAITTSLLS